MNFASVAAEEKNEQTYKQIGGIRFVLSFTDP